MPRSEAARRVGVTAQTLRRWARDGLVPHARDGRWTPAAVAQARIVARLRERGHSLDEIRAATESGRLAFGFVEELLPAHERTHTLEEAAAETGLEPALIERLFLSMGFNADAVSTSPTTTSSCCATWPPCSRPASRSSRCCSSCASTGRRSRRWPTPRSASSISTCTSRSCATASRDGRWARRWRSSRASCCRWPRRSWTACTSASWRTSSSRTSSGTWRPTSTGRRWTSGACAWPSPSPTWPATRA